MSITRTPTAAGIERAQAQRARIMAAARKCFVEYGFHAASMGNIAQQADMSPGLIYRYYASKSAIIIAIMERELEESRASIRSLNGSADIAEAIYLVYLDWRDRDALVNAALFAEMSAEATRDPAVASALSANDKVIREELAQVVNAGLTRRLGREVAPAVAERGALALQCFIEGLVMRSIREPDLDPQLVKTTIQDFFNGLGAYFK